MANTSFKVENGLLVQGNAQFDYTSKFNANVTVAADQWYIGGNLYVTGAQVFVGGNAAVADILAGAPGLNIGNTANQFSAYLSNVFVYGTLLNPVGNTVLLGNSTNRWVISGNTLNISTTSTLTGAATFANTIAVTGAATLANTLGVTGATTLSNTMSVTGAANALSTFGVGGAANALSTLGVNGATTLASTLSVSGAANALSTFGVNGVATFANTTSHIGAATFSNTLAVTGTSTLTGNTTLSGTLQTISGNAVFNTSTLFVDATNNRVGIGTTTPDTTLKVQGSFTANGAATLANTSAHTGSATFANTITVTGNATFSNVSTFVGNVTFNNTTTFNNDVLISANLTVTGTRTYVNTQTLDVGDNIVTLNADLPGATAPTENAGIEINRGSSANSRLQWTESTAAWQLSSGSVSTFYNIVNEGTTNTSLDSGTLFVDALNNRVGINTTTPAQVLEVVTGDTGIVSIASTAGGGRLWLSGNSSGSYVFNRDNAPLFFGTSNTSRMFIGSAGVLNHTANANFDSGTLFVDSVNNRVGVGTITPGSPLSVIGNADISGTANIQSNANVAGLLGVAGGLAVTGTTNTSAQFNVGGGVATTNGATITNTSILLGNSFVNTQISPSQILIRTNATGNTSSLLSLASTDQVGGSITLQHGNTTSNSTIVLGAQAGNNASIELGGTSAAFIDFKTPSEDDFDTRLQSNASGFHIVAGSSTSANVLNITSANVNIDAGTLFVDGINNRVGINNTAPGVALRVTGAADISSTANIQSNANVGGTLGVASLLTASGGLAVTGTANVSTNLNVSGTGNVQSTFGMAGAANALSTFGVNSLLTAAGGLTVTGTANVSAQFNVGGGVATTNGATITNTSIRVGNSSVNTQISPTQIIVDTSDGDGFTTVTGNLIIVFTSSGTANLSSTTLTIGTTTVNNSQVNSALYTAGLFGVTNGSTINATFMVIGNTTSNAIVSGNLISVSNTANLTSTTLTIGTTTVNNSQVNSALYTAGLFGVTNGATINATSIRIGNTTSNATVSGNLISVSNTANLTSTTLTIGTTTVTTALINTAAINVVNQTNTATLFVTTSANVGTFGVTNGVTINTTAIVVGNTTANATHAYNLLQASNSTFTANLSPSTLTIGTTTVNSSLVNTTAMTITSNTLTLGTSSISATGYSRLPNGLLMQWGNFLANSSTTIQNYATTFTTVYSGQATSANGTYSATYTAQIITLGTSGITVRTANVANTPVYYTVIGI